MFEPSLWYALTVTALLELVLHWAPWPRELPRIIAYLLGVAVILLGCAIWLVGIGQSGILLGIALICAAAGLATAAGWGIDWVRNLAVRVSVRHDGESE